MFSAYFNNKLTNDDIDIKSLNKSIDVFKKNWIFIINRKFCDIKNELKNIKDNNTFELKSNKETIKEVIKFLREKFNEIFDSESY